jgi:hypothetical protein
MRLTLADIEGLKQSGKIRDFKVMEKKPEQKKAKYGNQKTDVNGITLASKKEAKRYKELNLLLKAGKIGMLARQVEYELNVGGSHSLKYLADFVYIDRETGETIVEDVKGTRTPTYKKKRRLMKKLFNIEIKEL